MKRLALFLAASLAISSVASAQVTANLTFSGANNSPFTVSVNTPLTFETTSPSSNGLWIVFEGVGAFAPNPSDAQNGYETLNDTFTVGINGVQRPVSYIGNYFGADSPQQGVVSDDDLWLSVTFDSSNGLGPVASGTTVSLSAGNVSTDSSYNFALPSGGTFNVILADYYGNTISATAVPEPSTYAAAAGGLAMLAAIYRRRKQTQAK